MILSPDQPLFIHTFGRAVRVTAIFTDPDSANRFMDQNQSHGVLAEYAPFVLLAELSDLGMPLGRAAD